MNLRGKPASVRPALRVLIVEVAQEILKGVEEFSKEQERQWRKKTNGVQEGEEARAKSQVDWSTERPTSDSGKTATNGTPNTEGESQEKATLADKTKLIVDVIALNIELLPERKKISIVRHALHALPERCRT